MTEYILVLYGEYGIYLELFYDGIRILLNVCFQICDIILLFETSYT